MSDAVGSELVMTRDAIREYWLGHRRLTRRVLELFPEDQLFTYRIGGMRPFGEMVLELLAMAAPMARGLATGQWGEYAQDGPHDKAALLRQWDEDTADIEAAWASMPAGRLVETLTAFGQWTARGYELLQYVVDNEVHHRGQGYMYLRALGIEPPPFWERS
ncbi:MAG: damage-inducible protein DinB [Gemmatimonadetes bacterium]|nr:damage-inducible protein DinB [Gemmatimonadota bacterium]